MYGDIMNNNFNYYDLLGVKQDASEDEIKSAYKKQMKKWHPDINKEAEAVNMSSKINEAKEVLLDPVKRYDYDEYLKKKIKENYNRYTQRKQAYEKDTKDQVYEEKTVTKWQYFKEWFKYAKMPKIRKLIGVIGVMLETLLCFLIKCILIIISYIANFGSYFIRMLYGYISPILGLLFVLFVVMCISNGFNETIKENPGSLTAIIVVSVTYILSFILPYLSSLLLSPKVFDILYNKIDISLFKLCVGYKE